MVVRIRSDSRSCKVNKSSTVPSIVSVHNTLPVSVSHSSEPIRIFAASRRTLPDKTYCTSSFLPTDRTSVFAPRKPSVDNREMTKRSGREARAPTISSTMPSS